MESLLSVSTGRRCGTFVQSRQGRLGTFGGRVGRHGDCEDRILAWTLILHDEGGLRYHDCVQAHLERTGIPDFPNLSVLQTIRCR